MNRIIAFMPAALVAVATLVAADVAVADLAPPPPPKGKKYVSVGSEVVLSKDVTGYVFVQEHGTGPGRPQFSYKKLDLNADKTAAMPTGGRRSYVRLIAVPQDAAKEFKTDNELFDALKERKVKGVHSLNFTGTTIVPVSVKGDTVNWKYTITAIDPKGGIKTKIEGEGHEPPTDTPKKKDAPTKDDPDSSETGPSDSFTDSFGRSIPPGGMLIAGLTTFAAILLGGLWLAGRTRRKI